ncbi:uncharacterized protein BJX67DRAFT_387626 [Aspergillus lucknowensis]|uniref:DUF6536 domain-containing protein n=1 Tax=Aspergillus lucknowensis TaxID=176173 RepID=A0ABR4LT47_9EURO
MFYTRHVPNARDSEGRPKLLSRLTSWRCLSRKKETQGSRITASPSSDHGRAWIKGVVICAWVMGGVLALNIILTIIAAGLAYSKNDQQSFSFASMYKGKCSVVKDWTTALHLVINILSTAVLGASNYCMQCLASPSRAQVDEAHEKRTWVRIGVPNIANLLCRQRGNRQLLGWILLITSLPIHLIYNSAIYVSLGPMEYSVVAANSGPIRGNLSPDFEDCMLDNAGLDLPSFNAAMTGGDFTTLSKQECIHTFAQDYVSGQRMLVLVTNSSMPEAEPMGLIGAGNSKSFNDKSGSSFKWMCDNPDCTKDMAEESIDSWSVTPFRWSTPSILLRVPTTDGFYEGQGWLNLGSYGIPTTPDYKHLNDLLDQDPTERELQAQLDDPSQWVNSSFPGNVTLLGHEPQCFISEDQTDKLNQTYAVDHCMALSVEESCQLFFSPPICIIVIGCNIIKLLCALFTARDRREDVFLTIGDAIASFLDRPDPTTEGACLLSKPLVDKRTQGWRKAPGKKRKSRESRKLPEIEVDKANLPLRLPARKRWYQAVSISRWVCTITLFICMLIPSIYCLRLGVLDFNKAYGTKTIWDHGLGQVTTATILTGMDTPPTASGIFSMVLLANTPQLLVSVAYFMYNALLTIMLSAVEYDNYAVQRKPLRVSWPHGAQRSTYYLSLPYRYSLPLLLASAVLHWLVSQSFFFVDIIPFDRNGVPDSSGEVVTCGYSPVAIIFGIVVASALLLGSILLGLRRFRSHMPLAAQCSAAISAACHPAKLSPATDGDGGGHALKPVQWGELPGVYSPPRPLEFSNRVGGDTQTVLNNDSLHEDYLEGSDRETLSPATVDTGVAWSNSVGSGYYHCAFTSDDVHEPSLSRLYI